MDFNFEIIKTNSSGIKHKITPTGIWLQGQQCDGAFYRFHHILNVIPSASETSLSGKFMFLIIDGVIHVITFNLKGKDIFDDIIDFPFYFIDAHFGYQDEYLICLSANYSFTIISLITKKTIQSYNFRRFLSEDERSNLDNYRFDFNESRRVFSLFIDEGNVKYFALANEGNDLYVISQANHTTQDIEFHSEEEESTDQDNESPDPSEINTVQELKEVIIDQLNQNTAILVKKNNLLLQRKEAYEDEYKQCKEKYQQLKQRSQNIRSKYYELYKRINRLIESDEAPKNLQHIQQSFRKTQKEYQKINVGNGFVEPYILYNVSSLIGKINKKMSLIQESIYL